MKDESLIAKILLYEAIGFLAIILCSWVVEVTDLRTFILGEHPYISDFKESSFEMLIVLAVWLVVAGCTRKLLQRVSYLEKFMRVCAWCRHIHFKGKWIPLEEFIHQEFSTSTTHGICPECLQKEEAIIERHRAATAAAAAALTKTPAPVQPHS